MPDPKRFFNAVRRMAALSLLVSCSRSAPAPAGDSIPSQTMPVVGGTGGAPALDASSMIPTAADWSAADSATVRLSPTAFPDLPARIVRALLTRGCTVPQLWDERKPHNVVRGEFARPGQTDWAVLCSRAGRSTILVFWRASADSVAELGWATDVDFLQGVGDGKIGFSRRVGVAGRDYILDHYQEYGGPKPPPIDHDGIEDAFDGKGSAIAYFYEGRWLTLTGAD